MIIYIPKYSFTPRIPRQSSTTSRQHADELYKLFNNSVPNTNNASIRGHSCAYRSKLNDIDVEWTSRIVFEGELCNENPDSRSITSSNYNSL